MRINTTNEQEQNLDGVIIHGSVPRDPERSCKTCIKLNDCSILQYVLSNTEALDFVPKFSGVLPDVQSMPFPMPCRGDQWQSRPNRNFEQNPLVQRLGLGNVKDMSFNSGSK